MVPQTPRSPETPSTEEFLERVARLERLLEEKDRRIAELERLVEQSRRGGNRTSRGARTQSVLMTIARTARKRHLDGVRILADLRSALRTKSFIPLCSSRRADQRPASQ